MIDVKTAVKAATAYLKDFSDLISPTDLRLEETAFNEGREEWHITLSYVEGLGFDKRIYKEFQIDGNTGTVKSMRNPSP